MLHLKIYDIPPKEIDRTIKWLETIKQDCDYRISELKNMKASKDRATKWRQKMNDLAHEIYHENSELFHSGDFESRITYIQEHLDCDLARAGQIYDILKRWTKNERLKNRDKDILIAAQSGTKKPEIAKRFKLSRQQVYSILRKHNKKREQFLVD